MQTDRPFADRDRPSADRDRPCADRDRGRQKRPMRSDIWRGFRQEPDLSSLPPSLPSPGIRTPTLSLNTYKESECVCVYVCVYVCGCGAEIDSFDCVCLSSVLLLPFSLHSVAKQHGAHWSFHRCPARVPVNQTGKNENDVVCVCVVLTYPLSNHQGHCDIHTRAVSFVAEQEAVFPNIDLVS